MKKIKFSLHSLLDNNKFLLCLSLIIAIFIWCSVSPQREMKINCPLTLTTENTSAEKLGLQIIDGSEQNISVVVEGEWYTISDLSADDITLSYSFGGIVESGVYNIAITATKTNNTADFTITSVSPAEVKVSLDHISTVKYPIEVITNNIKAEDGLIVGTPIVDKGKDEIEITGPASKLNKLKRVVAEVNVEETLSKSQVFTTELKFLNKNNKEMDVSQFTLPYTDVDVIVPINQTKTVPINVQFKNAPEAYASNPIAYSISNKEIELVGTKEALSKIDSITLDEIDFKELTPNNNEFKINLNLPSGVTASNGISEVTVTVDLSDFEEKTINISNFKTVNLKKGTVAKVETAYKSITVVGPKNIISSLKSNEVYLECDLSNISGASGSITAEGIVKSNKYKTIWGTGDSEVRIKISEQ